MSTKRTFLFLIMCFMLILLLSGCGTTEKGIAKEQVDPREREIIIFLNNQDYDGAIQKANELYKGENENLKRILESIEGSRAMEKELKNMQQSLYASSKLEIQEGYKPEITNGYITITGRVKNVSDDKIRYFEVVVKFLDNNEQVLDSGYTNDGLELKPGEMREFKISHRWNDEYKRYKLSIGEVK